MRFPIASLVRHTCALVISTCLATASALAQTPQDRNDRTEHVLIHAAMADAGQTTVIVEGKNFDRDAVVYLAGVPLGGVTVNATGTVLTATIAGTLPGSYRLQVSNGRSATQNAYFEVTLGAVGPQGPQGLQGLQGLPGPDHSGAIAELQAQIDALSTRAESLEQLLQHFSRSGDDVIIEGANLYVRSGSGSTNGAVNGRGNLVVGYNELRGTGDDRSGSHNLVVGSQHNYSAYGGFVAGSGKALTDAFATQISGSSFTVKATLIDLDAAATAKLRGGASVEATSGAAMGIKSSGTMEIKGALVKIN